MSGLFFILFTQNRQTLSALMELEHSVEILIFCHAVLGTIALLAGALALVATKGGAWHKRSGRVFYYTMLASTGLAVFIAVLPKHQNPFLFSIGLFSAYFLLSGYSSLRFRKENWSKRADTAMAYTIVLTGIGMLVYAGFYSGSLVLLVFGVVGLIFGIRDIQMLRRPEQLKAKWLKLHLGKMTGGYIAAVSAFLVVNDVLPGLWNWFVPSLVGSGYITYWIRRLNSGKT